MASTLKTNAIEPEGGTTNMVVGESGQNTVIGNNDIRANVLQDSGGNAIFTSDGSGNLSGVSSDFGGAEVLISSQTVSNQASVSFTSGIDSTYGEYIFKFYNINPATDSAKFQCQWNAVGGSGFDETFTSASFDAYHNEDNNATNFVYVTAQGPSQTSGTQLLAQTIGNGADESLAGEFRLFSPASTTYIKHYISEVNFYHGVGNGTSVRTRVAGYINTTTAIDEIEFKMNTGNFDGTIKMWGSK